MSACKYFVGILNGLKNHIRLGTKNRKYQVFISSTYQDLIQYRRAVSDEIAFRGHFSAGMEDFTACGDDLETYIKKVIDESDYYILIIGQRFGTSTEQDENISYTMMEYRYAKSKKMRIIPFIYNGTLTLVGNDMDTNKDKFDKFVEEVNKIQVPTGSYIEKKLLKEGETPRITVTGVNNGISGYFEDLTSNSNYRVYENFISVSFLGTVFYHPYKASLDMKVHSLKLKNKELNEYIGGYIVSVIKKSIQNNDYADQISSTVLPQLKIKLPIDINGNPNFAYMEEYMKNLEIEVNSSLHLFLLV